MSDSPTKGLLSTGDHQSRWTSGLPARQCSSKNVYRSSVLILLGLILLSPFAVLKRDIVLTVVNEYVQVGGADSITDSTARGPGQQHDEQRGRGTLSSLGSSETYNEKQRRVQCAPANKESTLNGLFHVPLLETLGSWTSEKTLDLDTSISIVTQLSIDRLPMLENQCRSWEDALVATIYVPLEQQKGKKSGNIGSPTPYGMRSSLQDIQRSISSFFSLMEATSKTCALHIQLVGQEIEDERASPYPINALRNRAMALARTPLVFVLDVDFVPSPNLGLPGDGYKDPAVYHKLMQVAYKKAAVVVPAFELVEGRQMEPYIGENLVKGLVQDGKNVLRKAYKQELVRAFNGRDFEAGHGPTNTSRWIRGNDPHFMYEVEYQDRYEPFMILAREMAPHADERFVGYGANKLVYVRSLQASGFTFHVHGGGFAVHVPHAKTRAANIFQGHRKGRNRDPMDVLRDVVERSMDEGSFKPVLRDCQL